MPRLLFLATLLAASPAALADPALVPPPKFDGLGTHSRKVSENKDAQAYFDQGLAFLYAFNHDEAIRAFEHAAKIDPECAMAHWGVALACGGHINKPVMDTATMKKAVAAMTQADRQVQTVGEADAALIVAVVVRYTEKPNEDQEKRNKAYSQAMKAAWEKHPKDADIGAIYAESLMNLRPWDCGRSTASRATTRPSWCPRWRR